MKKTVLALASAFTIFATTLVKAQDMPFGFGIKGGGINSVITGLEEAKKPFGGSETGLLNAGGQVGLFGEYAFHENVGVGLEALYALQGGSFTKKGDKNKSYGISIHQVNIIPLLRIYPMGREEDEDILSLHLGPDFVIPFIGSAQEKGQKAQDIKADLNAFGVGILGGVSYEFAFGLQTELRGSYGFMDVFKEDSNFKTQTLGIAKDKATNSWYTSFNLGYNFARLMMD